MSAPGDGGIVIVGGGPAALSCARGYRAAGGGAPVTMLSAEPIAPYERPPLTKDLLREAVAARIAGPRAADPDVAEVATESGLLLEAPRWFAQQRIDLILAAVVTEIDLDRRTVSLQDGRRVAAQRTVIATGCEPVRLPIDGADDPRVMTMRTLADSRRLATQAARDPRVTVIGTGFIGCEIAGSLAAQGIEVSLIGEDYLPQIERLGEDVAARLAGWLRDAGVSLIGGVSVTAIEAARTVLLGDGRRIDGGCVVLATGVRPRGELARDAGVQTVDGAVRVDGALTASDPRVLAAGDVARAYNHAAARSLRVEHWGDALAQGELAGRVLAGEEQRRWEDVPGFWSTIGARTVKYAAWGDGHDRCRIVDHGEDSFTAWYLRENTVVGVLTHACDSDYERGRELILAGATSSELAVQENRS